jgi:hypothetical protein
MRFVVLHRRCYDIWAFITPFLSIIGIKCQLTVSVLIFWISLSFQTKKKYVGLPMCIVTTLDLSLFTA